MPCWGNAGLLPPVAVDVSSARQPRQVRVVAGDENVAGFTSKTIRNPVRRVIGLQIARRRELRERVAGAPERLGRLTGAKLAAVPHDRRTCAPRGRFGGQTLDVRRARSWRAGGGRSTSGTDRVAVMDEVQ